MGKILGYYTKYLNDVPAYKNWTLEQGKNQKGNNTDVSELRKKARAIAEPILLFEKYEHENMEDAETFYQTFNIELMSLAGLISSLPLAITKILPSSDKKIASNSMVKKFSEAIKTYEKSNLKIAGKKLPLPKVLTVISTLFSAAFFAFGIKHSLNSQLGIQRKANFDALQNIISNPKYYALLDENEEKSVNGIVNNQEKNNSELLNKLKDKMDINSSFQTVKDYSQTYSKYKAEKEQYFEELNKQVNKNKPASDIERMKSNQDKVLLNSYLKNVEHDVLEPLRRVETISNISYSAMFTGGFLEYLLTDKLVNVLGIKSKPLQLITKIGAPLITYLILNKNISDLENKAILAIKYKYLKNFCENPLNCEKQKSDKKESLPQFLKSVYRDMKDYEVFSENELPKIEERLGVKTQIPFSKDKEDDAKRLQKNTAMVLNTQREHLFNQSVGIKSLSETLLGPIDVVSTAIGAKIGSSLAKKFPNIKSKKLLTGIGAVLAFIPAAYIEAKLTKQQKLSEKTAVMLAVKDFDNSKKFELNTTSTKIKSTNILQTILSDKNN